MATAAGPPPPAPWGRGDGPAGLPLLHHAEGHNPDWIFIASSGVIQPVSGLVLIHLAGFDYLESWLVATYVLYGIAAICWIRVVFLQYRMRVLAEAARATAAALPPDYYSAMRLWFVLGWPAFVALLVVLALMVMKPALW